MSGSVFPDYLEVATAVVEVKLLPVHRYSVNICSYSGPSGIRGSDVEKLFQNFSVI